MRRKSARAIVINEHNQMLWLEVQGDIGRGGLTRFWCVPGGGLEPGETFPEALRREILEEIGLELDHRDDYSHVSTVEKQVIIGGKPSFEHSRFFLVRVEKPLLKFENPDLAELETFLGHRWWSHEDIQTSSELFLPQDIVEVFGVLARGQWDGKIKRIC